MRSSIKSLELLDQMLVVSKNYSLLIPKEIDIVLVSYIGFEPMTFFLKVNYKIKIKLFLNQENLSDRNARKSPGLVSCPCSRYPVM